MSRKGIVISGKIIFLLAFLAMIALFGAVGEETTDRMKIEIGNAVLTASLESNPAADALKELLAAGAITVSVSNYGGWEKVGALPEALPANDRQLTAQNGDIMLYCGDQIVFFYGSNSWSYTKLGRIVGSSADEIISALSTSDSEMTLSLM